MLCKEKNIEISVWSASGLNLTSLDPSITNELEVYAESQVKLFEQFLFKSSRYASDQLFTSSQQSASQRLLLLVKEIPNVFFRDGGRSQFAACLRQFIKYSKYPLVFIVTQGSYSSNGGGSFGDSCNPNRLFTSDLKRELGIVEVNFNAVANTFLMKHLERIAKLEGMTAADRPLLESLCQMANGDLRNAVNTLEMACAGQNKPSAVKLSQAQSQSTAKRLL